MQYPKSRGKSSGDGQRPQRRENRKDWSSDSKGRPRRAESPAGSGYKKRERDPEASSRRPESRSGQKFGAKGASDTKPRFDRRRAETQGSSENARRREGEPRRREGEPRRDWGQTRRGEDQRTRRPRQEERPAEELRPRLGHEARPDEPETPKDYDESLLPFGARAELKGLTITMAEEVAAHLVAAGTLLDEDPELAYRHAEAARRRAPRLPIVREAAAEAAYVAGEYEAALREYRALRRMNGSAEYTAVIADCERAVGRPRAALELIKETDLSRLSATQRIELIIVEAGARADLDQRDEAVRILAEAIKTGSGPRLGQARLRYAYAEQLIAAGQLAPGREWLQAALKFDPDDELGISERLEELD